MTQPTPNESLTLYHYWRSSASWRVRWALALKGLTYESRPINLLKGEQRSAPYLKLNPAGQVPCLLIAGDPCCESMAIIEYLDEKYPKTPLLPQGAMDRLRVRQASLIIVAGTQPLQNLAPQNFYSNDLDLRTKWCQHWISLGLRAYEDCIRKQAGTFSFGSQLTMADLCLVPQAANALRYQISLDDFPIVKGIYERCMKDKVCYGASPAGQPESKEL